MTENQVTVALEKFRPYMPTDYCGNIVHEGIMLKPKLEAASEDCMDGLMNLPLKSKTTAILLSVFLGGIGAGRFYIGDTWLGVLRIVASVISMILSVFVAIIGSIASVALFRSIASVALFIWTVVDVFLVAKRVKLVNFDKVNAYLYHANNRW